MEGHWKFLGGGGVFKAKCLEAMYGNKLEFPGGGGGGCKTKTFCGEGYRYFLKLHIQFRMCHFEEFVEPFL